VDRLTGGTREKPNHEEAFLLWKREKDKLLKQKKIEQKIQKEKMKSDEEKNAAAEMVSQISLKIIFPKLLAKSKISNPSRNKEMLLGKVYLGSHLSFSCFWLHLNIILLALQVVAFKRFPHQTAQTRSVCCREVAEHHIII
jgi:hypothetical protein